MTKEQVTDLVNVTLDAELRRRGLPVASRESSSPGGGHLELRESSQEKLATLQLAEAEQKELAGLFEEMGLTPACAIAAAKGRQESYR